MQRRAFLKAGGAASLGLAFSSCAPLFSLGSGRPRVNLVPVDVSWDRIIRTTVGLRPHRESGFRLDAELLDDKMLIHNYGHGGAGVSLSWGTAYLAAELALLHTERRAAVIGCGMVGLTSARQLQRRGFEVTIYAMALPPETTSNLSLCMFTPRSGLVSVGQRTPEWETQFRRAVEIAYREHQLMVGPRYGISWIDEYSLTNNSAVAARIAEASPSPSPSNSPSPSPSERDSTPRPLLPSTVELGRVVLQPGEHPFGTRYATRRPNLRFEPSILLDALMRDVLTFGGRIVVRRFDSPRDLMALTEPIIVNCTGLGAKHLFNDEQMVPVKGQLTVLVPQPEVTYSIGSMLPRADGIVLGHVMERGSWSLEVDQEQQRRVVETHIRIFSAMRAPDRRLAATSFESTRSAPPVESFFDRES